jgi:hypothetical protein
MATAITRGGNLCGAWWQRPQLVRNLFSPSSLSERSTAAASGADVAASEECAAAELPDWPPLEAEAVALDEAAEWERSWAMAEKTNPAVKLSRTARM